MTRFTLLVLCCSQLLSTSLSAASPTAGKTLQSTVRAGTQNVQHEPPELTGRPQAAPPPPGPALRQFAQSKVIRAADPENPKTLRPAIAELTDLIRQEPHNSDFYFLRASLACYARADHVNVLNDLAQSISLRGPRRNGDETLKERYALRAKVEFDNHRYDDAMRDLDTAIKQDYDSAQQIFNDGGTKPSTIAKPCVWTLADLDTLAERYPTDYRPPLYRGLYLSYFLAFDLESDYTPLIDAFERAATLNPASPLPHFFSGELYTIGRLGGVMSTANAKCLDYVVPRTPACLALDEARRTGIRSLTRAIALDPTFMHAYAIRANALYDLKEYQQAVRDYDEVLKLAPEGDTVRSIYNDRGLAKMALGHYHSAILDFSRSIALGCSELCQSYENRADAYLKLHNYTMAIADIGRSIELVLPSALYMMNIEQFRRIYPEYDAVPDDVLCEKLRRLFYHALSYTSFANEFLIKAKEYSSTVLPDFFVKRGDAYMALHQAAKANAEYDRVSRAFPEWAAVVFTQKNGSRVRKPE